MTERRIILEMAYNESLAEASAAFAAGESAALEAAALPSFDTFSYDDTYVSEPLPNIQAGAHPENELFDPMANLAVDDSPAASTYLVRGTVADEDMAAFETEVNRKRSVVGYYSDVEIANFAVCPGSPAVGNDQTVEQLLCVPRMRQCDMDGEGVLVAIVDTGINLAYLNAHGKTPNFDAARSWKWDGAAPAQAAFRLITAQWSPTMSASPHPNVQSWTLRCCTDFFRHRPDLPERSCLMPYVLTAICSM